MKTAIIYFSKLFIVSLLFTQITFAQETTDFGTWNSIGVDYTLKKKIKISLEYNIRTKNNASVLDERFSEIGLEYKLFKKLELGGSVRFIDENDTQGKKQGIRKYFRYQFDVTYKYDLDRFSLNHRFRYQNKNEVSVSELEGDIPSENIRFRTGISYNFKKWPLDPEFDAEIFRNISSDQKDIFTKYRLTFGTSYKWKKIGQFGINYRYEKSLNETLPINFSIFELRYKYSIN